MTSCSKMFFKEHWLIINMYLFVIPQNILTFPPTIENTTKLRPENMYLYNVIITMK